MVFIPVKKIAKFSALVDKLKAERIRRNDPNFGRPKRRTMLSQSSLAKVSDRKVRRFGRDLDAFNPVMGKKRREFPGLKGTLGRKLSPKALSKVSQRKLDKFSRPSRKERRAKERERQEALRRAKTDIV
ncbi:MAG: hypothetical protein ABH986_05935 [archaeon]